MRTSQLIAALNRKLRVRGSLMCLAYYFNMLYIGVYTTSGRLVQKLNDCTGVCLPADSYHDAEYLP